MKHTLSIAAAAVLVASAAHAATIAADDASDPMYDDAGSPNGDNGGVGFNAFTGAGNAGSSGSGGAFVGSGNTDIGSGASNEFFGVFGNGGGVGQIFRPFMGELSIGQTFSIDFDNGDVNGGGSVGFGLQDGSGNNLFEFFFVGGTTEYQVNREGGAVNTGIGFTSSGLSLAVTRTDADEFSAAITPAGSSTTVITGDFAGPDGSGPSQLRVFNANGGADVAFNNLAIVPEPIATLGGSALLGLIALRRRK